MAPDGCGEDRRNPGARDRRSAAERRRVDGAAPEGRRRSGDQLPPLCSRVGASGRNFKRGGMRIAPPRAVSVEQLEESHLLLIGQTRSGKTYQLRGAIEQLRLADRRVGAIDKVGN